MLEAGIDVFSTVNVQHLESAQRPGRRAHRHARARDDARRVLGRGRRGRARRPHARGADRAAARRQGLPGERVEAALNNFFKIENLAALREVALRQVAEEVEAKRLVARTRARRTRRARCSRARAAGGRRAAARARHAAPKSQRVVRRAWRSAQRLGGRARHAVREPARRRAPEEREQLEALRRLAALLGAHLLVEEGDDVAGRSRRVAAERGHHLRADGHAALAQGAAALRPSLPVPAARSCCPASTSASSPTAPSAPRRPMIWRLVIRPSLLVLGLVCWAR